MNEVLEPFDLYSAQWAVIYVLKTKGILTQTELCNYLAIEAPPLTRTIQKLVRQGYVKQLPGEDKRTKLIALTDAALREYPRWENAVLKMNIEVLNKFPKSKQDSLHFLLSELLEVIKHQDDEEKTNAQ
jgi:DNA-binding MarR family transcriptional regulator